MVELLALAADKADDSKQIDIPTILADLEARISVLESAGVRVWVSGMVTKKGQTVLYDILKEGMMRYLRYDGGRESTSLSPEKLTDGLSWHQRAVLSHIPWKRTRMEISSLCL